MKPAGHRTKDNIILVYREEMEESLVMVDTGTILVGSYILFDPIECPTTQRL
jgi:hypothetical protein